jgi:hypothetical protein
LEPQLGVLGLVLAGLFVVTLEPLLHVLVVRLDHLERFLDAPEAQLRIGLRGSVLIFVLAIALDLFAAVSDLDQP